MRTRSAQHLAVVASIIGALVSASPASADTRLCRYTSGRNENKIVKVELPERCPQGTEQLLYQADIYGASNTNLTIAAGDPESLTDDFTEYRNCTIRAGATLLVPSGTVLRCNGTFNNAGTISVGERAHGGVRIVSSSNGVFSFRSSPPYPGIFGAIPQDGNYLVSSTETAPGASFSYGGLSAFSTRMIPSHLAGGGGAAGADSSASDNGGDGGGSLFIYARGRITNTGSIVADGSSSSMHGGGGGGGGLILLASPVAVVNAGTISVRGGAGGDAAIDESLHYAVGGGGGGGGGQIIIVSPSVSTGSLLYTGGAGGAGYEAGAGALQVNRFGGGGGGIGLAGGGRGGSCGTSSIEAGTEGFEGALEYVAKDPKLVF